MNKRYIVRKLNPRAPGYLYLKGFTPAIIGELSNCEAVPAYDGPLQSAPIWTGDPQDAMTYERVDHVEAVALWLEAGTLEVVRP